MAQVVALLESMWGWGGFNDPGAMAPRFFRINPENHSGKRLYRLCGNNDLLVTNCCSVVQKSASDHGKPDLQWTRDNLRMAGKFDLLLVCGKVAKDTFMQVRDENPLYQILYIDHPAARRWTQRKLIEIAEEISQLCRA